MGDQAIEADVKPAGPFEAEPAIVVWLLLTFPQRRARVVRVSALA